MSRDKDKGTGPGVAAKVQQVPARTSIQATGQGLPRGKAVDSGPCEIRYAEDTRYPGKTFLDEVHVDHPTHVHFESMGDDHLWCGIDLADGRQVHVNIVATGRAKLQWRAEVEGPQPAAAQEPQSDPSAPQSPAVEAAPQMVPK